MSTPATRIVSVVPSIELELDGKCVTLKYTHHALHAAGANPYDGSLGKLMGSLTPAEGVKFIRAGMSADNQKVWTIDALNDQLGPSTVVQVVGAIASQFKALIGGDDGENPPAAAA